MEHRKLPSVNDLLADQIFISLINRYGRTIVRDCLRSILESYRTNITGLSEIEVTPESLAKKVFEELVERTTCNIKPIVNATGTVLHTNLGRAPLPAEAIHAASLVAAGYCNLEISLETGKRGKRTDHVGKTICQLTGAEAAIAVNNNAGAVILVLSALAKDREVIISRGELVEIGGGFRIPEIMEASGGYLREVGTTNRTHLRDYENAVTENTGLIMKAHQSNFEIVGFTSSVSVADLVSVGNTHQIPVMYDLGSGNFFPGESFGWSAPIVSDQIKQNVDIVTFSGDKLLGGPQAGIIVGRKEYIDIIAKHPLARALRLDKMTLAALDATLKLYLHPESVIDNIPTLNALCCPEKELRQKAGKLYSALKTFLPDCFELNLQQSNSTPGGGCMPSTMLKTWVVSIKSKEMSTAQISAGLRHAPNPVIARIQNDEILLDVRTVPESQFDILINTVKSSLAIVK